MTPTGMFGSPINIPTTPVAVGPYSVKVADFNGDGKLDLLVNTYGNGRDIDQIIFGNGTGAFSSAPETIFSSVQPYDSYDAVGDFNGDGVPDIAIANQSSDCISVLLGNGNGTFAPAVNYPTGPGPSDLATGDFNGDGKLDLAIFKQTSGTLGLAGTGSVGIMLGDGNGGFSAPINNAIPFVPGAIAVGDFNGDGNLDLAITNPLNNDVAILLGNGNGTFGPAVNYPAGSFISSIAVGDFSGNGKLDIAVTDDYVVSVLLGNGNGSFSAPTSYSFGSNPYFLSGTNPGSVTVGDFNGDNIPDLAVTTDANVVSVFLGNGNGTFGAAQNYQVEFQPNGTVAQLSALGVGNFTSDGKLDLVVAQNGADPISILLNQETATHFQITAPPAVPVDSNFQVTVTALDSSNNTDGYYSGFLQFSSTDSAAFLPSLVTLTNGVGVFSVSLRTAGSQTITASDATTGSITGITSPISVENPATHLAVFAAPTTIQAGNGFILNVVAQDQNNNTVTIYGGTVQVTCTDPLAQLPADTTLTDGVGVFAVVMRTAGAQNFAAADTLFTGISGTSALIKVTAIAANHFGVTAPATAVTGSPTAFTVTALDPYGNLAPTYTGTVHFSSSDSAAMLPRDSTLSGGSGVFSATLASSGNQTISATDIASGMKGVSAAIAVRGLIVTGLLPTPTGFEATFDKPFDPTTLSLYYAPDDVLLVKGSAAFIHGSLALNTASGSPPDTSFTFVATSGVLTAGTYTVTLVSGVSGIKDTSGVELDGTASGIPGNSYVTTFTVASTPSVVLSIPDFARGPNSSANILLPNNTGSGIPITLTGAANLTAATFYVTYNPALLNISGTLNGPSGTFTLLVQHRRRGQLRLPKQHAFERHHHAGLHRRPGAQQRRRQLQNQSTAAPGQHRHQRQHHHGDKQRRHRGRGLSRRRRGHRQFQPVGCGADRPGGGRHRERFFGLSATRPGHHRRRGRHRQRQLRPTSP